MKIAIQGHLERGNEVIQILENLGGVNRMYHSGRFPKYFYYISSDDNTIAWTCVRPKHFSVYTLEKFKKQFPFKIGEKVILPDYSNKKGTIVSIEPCGPVLSYFIKLETGNGIYRPAKSLKPYKEMQERNITLTLSKAREWYQKGGELKEVALQAYSEKELIKVESPKTWEEFCKNYPIKPGETFVDGYSKLVVNNLGTRNPTYDKNICPSQKSAKAHLAMIQLEQLRDCWLDGWTPIWDISEKWCIRSWGNELCVGITTNISRFLTFPTKEMAEEFLECFRDLIELAKYLI